MKKVISIIGARPQFIKHAPIALAMQDCFELRTVHTGQHYDDNMSNVFFEELHIPKPDYELEVGSGLHGQQTGDMLKAIEEIYLFEKPNAVLVYGDTNSTLAGALAAVKLQIPVIHIEAGLRSFNKSMPEEINRLLTDQISDLLFCPNETALKQLRKEGIEAAAHITGDIMADLLKISAPKLEKISADFVYATIHRPYNTDNMDRLSKILDSLNDLPWRVIFSLHPRTKQVMHANGLQASNYQNITFIAPLGYFENLKHLNSAKALVTDSGGMQKEAYLVRTPCLTLRSETEWTETLEHGWNQLLFHDLSTMREKLESQLLHITNNHPLHDNLLFGDGQAAKQIISHIEHFLN